jgi:chitodextrinase
MTPFTTTGGTTHSTLITGLSDGTSYTYYVRCKDAAGNISGTASVAFSVATPAPPVDATAPSAPLNVVASAASATQTSLAWDASTDNVGVVGYKVYRDGTQVGTSNTTSYQDTGLAASTVYSYTVAAYDAVGNTSAQSTGSSVITLSSVQSIAVGGRVVTINNLNIRAKASLSGAKRGCKV